MVLVEDTRNQKGKHELKHLWFGLHHIPFCRCKLPVGDYALPPERAVDTKASLAEIAQNIGGNKQEHNRFINELKFAQELGTKLFILVECEAGYDTVEDVARWRNPREEYSPNCIQGPRLARAMRTIEERYGCTFLFCRPEEAGEMIADLLRKLT